ncbi:MAG: efflux RND transporter periplasmic adaptor subunit [Candidatus Paceibacterota bacterium]
MKNLFLKIKTYAIAHKIISIVVLIILVYGSYWSYNKLTSTSGETRYVLDTVKKGTIISSVTGSGQVSASNTVELKSKASGDVVYLANLEGQSVKSGTLIARLDTTSADKTVRDAQANLDSAKLSLEKTKQPADTLSLLQAQNAITNAEQSKKQAQDDLNKAYDDAFTAISNAFLDLPTVITGVQSVLYDNDYSSSQSNISYYNDLVQSWDTNVSNYRDNAASTYQTARTAYDKNFLDYKSTSRYADTQTIEKLLNETYATTKSISESVKSSSDLLSFVKDQLTTHNRNFPSQLTTDQTSLGTYTSKANSNLLSLLNMINTIKNDKNSIANSDLTIQEKTESLKKLQAGADTLDIQSSELSIKQRENALLDAQDTLANYYIRAPFDGVVAKINITALDSVSSGTSVATLVTKQKIAELSLNEVDAAKVKVGQKATLTFDAISDLSIAGQVSQVDSIGTVSQGVVTYAIKINFDTQDDRVKSGMSVSASIITDSKQDVLVVPSSAVKSQNGTSYVEIFSPALTATSGTQGTPSATAPKQQTVEVGLSDDTSIEIISGLKEGDQIVTKTITASSATTKTTTATSLFGGGGARNGGSASGAVKIPRVD